jgi:DNA polymerase IV
MSERKIIHLDLDAFFCAAEELRRPELRGKAFAVGGKPQERGVVSSCSYPARAFGVRSAMPMYKALRLCAELIVVQADHRYYSELSAQVMAILGEHTGLLEQISIDEAFLDLSDLPQPALELARTLQAQINTRLRLPCSLGVARSKLVAKIATDTGKARHKLPSPPNTILVVPPGEEAAFLAPLPASALWGVGPKTAARLAELDILSIGDLAKANEAQLARLFGITGPELIQRARGIDERPVQVEHAAKSISAELTFERDTADGQRLRDTLRAQSEEVARHLREAGLCAATVRIKIRWPDFSTHTRQQPLAQPSDQDQQIYAAALELFGGIWTAGKAVRLLGLGASGLSPAVHQLSLWDTADQKERRLLEALDTLRTRYGDKAVQAGRKIKKG